jgi:hypothetical protein
MQASIATFPAKPREEITPFTIAIMQPYFIPYAGYFRLFPASHLFVIYDCVQFPRRGWVHRNRLIDRFGNERWLTLPLKKASQEVKIMDLQFHEDASTIMAERLRQFPFSSPAQEVRHIINSLYNLDGTPVDYIERLLRDIVEYLGAPWNVMRSSALDVSTSLRGQERIIEIARRLGARRYVNLAGGRSLYDSNTFGEADLELRFLPDHAGPKTSILSRLIRESRDELSNEIHLF